MLIVQQKESRKDSKDRWHRVHFRRHRLSYGDIEGLYGRNGIEADSFSISAGSSSLIYRRADSR